jgi:mannosyltransferase
VRTQTTLVLLTVAAGVLRFSTLGVQSYWGDEGFTVAIVNHGLGGILGAVRRTESTPPLFYFVAWGWRHVFGTGAVGLRSLSALLGTLTVPVSFAAASALFSRRVGLMCAAFISFSPLLVWYSQEARAYSLLLFLGTLSLWYFARVIRGDRRAVAWWAVTSALAIATHYFALFTVAPEAIWLVASRPRDRHRRAAVGIPGTVFLVLLPLLIYQDQHVMRPWTTGYGLTNAITGVTQGALVGPTWTPLTHRVGVGVLALLAATGLIILTSDKARLRQATLPFGLLAASIGVPLAIALVGPNYVAIRNVILAVPLGWAIVAAGFASAHSSRLRMVLVTCTCTIGCGIAIAVPLTPSMQRADWRGAIKALDSPPASRVWVFLDRFDSAPISSSYLPQAVPLSSTAVLTSEIDLVGRVGFPNVLKSSLVPGFRLVDRRLIGGLWISRFRAPRLIALTYPEFRDLDAWVVTQRR